MLGYHVPVRCTSPSSCDIRPISRRSPETLAGAHPRLWGRTFLSPATLGRQEQLERLDQSRQRGGQNRLVQAIGSMKIINIIGCLDSFWTPRLYDTGRLELFLM